MRGLSLFAYFAAEKARVCNERMTANGDCGHRIRSCFLSQSVIATWREIS